MIRLALPSEPYPIDLPHGVAVTVRPCDTAVYEAARLKMARTVRDLVRQKEEAERAGMRLDGLPDMSDDDRIAGFSQFLFAQALARGAIVSWTGVLDATGEPAPVTDRTVSDLMRVPRIAEAFVVAYTKPHADLVSEGNGSGSAPAGTTAAEPSTAAGAGTSKRTAPAAGATP
jgi:hypothetical protein